MAISRRGFFRLSTATALFTALPPVVQRWTPAPIRRAFDMAAVDKALRAQYLPLVQEMLNRQTVLMSLLEKDTGPLPTDQTFTLPTHTGRNSR